MRKILFLLLMSLPMAVSAFDFYVGGIYYNINGNEATVTYRNTSSPSYFRDVVIPETVTYNGVTYRVTAIGSSAFNKCTSLTSITIPNSVTYIGWWAFYGCTSLSSVTIPNSVTSIDNYAFRNCGGLEIIEIPNSVSYIGVAALDGTIWYDNQPDGLVYAGLVAYGYKGTMPNNTNLSLREGTLGIAGGAFQNCRNLTGITIPNSVIVIGYYSFASCEGLTDITIPTSVTTIMWYAFELCTGLKSIEIPSSVSSIGGEVFEGCYNLESIIVDSENPIYDSRNNCNAIIETANDSLLVGCKNTIIPNSVVSIGEYAFHGCRNLTGTLNIPNSVTLIGEKAFLYCVGLTSITLGNSVARIESKAFSYCSNLKSINLPNSITYISNDAFENSNYLSTLIITGEGEWQEVSLSSITSTSPKLYIDSRITGIKRMFAPHSDVYCYATEPPTCDNYSFKNYSGTLHVPAASLAAYFTAEYWCNFANIVGDAVELEGVSVNQDSVVANLGDQFNLTATLTPSNATPINFLWITSNANIATVYNGTVTAVGVGECDIIAQCLNKQAICHVIVNDTTVTISLDQQEAMVLPNHIIILTPSASPIMPDLAVSSSDPSVAAARVVNNKIQVVGIKEGTTMITVGSVDGTAIPATCLVTVYTKPGDINCDGFVNISDVTSLIDYLLSGDNSQISTKNADVNGDENINISDVTTLIDILLSGNG